MRRKLQRLVETIVNFIRMNLASLTVNNSRRVIEENEKWQVIMNVKKESEVILEEYKDGAAIIMPSQRWIVQGKCSYSGMSEMPTSLEM
ncbi:hypothetical protein Tco_0606010 [Tanacetum coccineum]